MPQVSFGWLCCTEHFSSVNAQCRLLEFEKPYVLKPAHADTDPGCLQRTRASTSVHLIFSSITPPSREDIVTVDYQRPPLLGVPQPPIAAVLLRSERLPALELQNHWIEQQKIPLRWIGLLCRGKYPHVGLPNDYTQYSFCCSLYKNV